MLASEFWKAPGVGPQPFEAEIVGVMHSEIENDPWFLGDTSDPYPANVGVIVSFEYLQNCKRTTSSGDGYVTCAVVSRYGEHAEEIYTWLNLWKKGLDTEALLARWAWCEEPGLFTYDLESGDGDWLYMAMRILFTNEISVYFKPVPYLGVFAAAILGYFAASTVYGKRRSVGILRSMGASRKRIFLAVLLPLAVFALAVSLITFGAECVILHFTNAKLKSLIVPFDVNAKFYYFFTLNWQTLLFIFAVPLLIVCIVAAVFTWMESQKPVAQTLSRAPRSLFRRKKH